MDSPAVTSSSEFSLQPVSTSNSSRGTHLQVSSNFPSDCLLTRTPSSIKENGNERGDAKYNLMVSKRNCGFNVMVPGVVNHNPHTFVNLLLGRLEFSPSQIGNLHSLTNVWLFL